MKNKSILLLMLSLASLTFADGFSLKNSVGYEGNLDNNKTYTNKSVPLKSVFKYEPSGINLTWETTLTKDFLNSDLPGFETKLDYTTSNTIPATALRAYLDLNTTGAVEAKGGFVFTLTNTTKVNVLANAKTTDFVNLSYIGGELSIARKATTNSQTFTAKLGSDLKESHLLGTLNLETKFNVGKLTLEPSVKSDYDVMVNDNTKSNATIKVEFLGLEAQIIDAMKLKFNNELDITVANSALTQTVNTTNLKFEYVPNVVSTFAIGPKVSVGLVATTDYNKPASQSTTTTKVDFNQELGLQMKYMPISNVELGLYTYVKADETLTSPAKFNTLNPGATLELNFNW